MKKVMLLAALVGFSAATFAQDATPAQPVKKHKAHKHAMVKKTETKTESKTMDKSAAK